MSAAGTQRRGRQAGFSLLEVIAALGLLGLTALFMAQGLAFGAGAAARLTAHTNGALDQMAARRSLARLVGQALPPAPIPGFAPGGATLFEGYPHSLSFVRRGEGAADPGVHVLSRLEIAGTRLTLTDCPVPEPANQQLDRPPVCAGPARVRLTLDSASPLRLGYQQAAGRRLGQWTGQDRLPRAVLLRTDQGDMLAIALALGRSW